MAKALFYEKGNGDFMGKSKTKMPAELKRKCHMAIHTATVGAVAGGASPIPISDAVIISGVQVAMIIKLGRVFDISISESTAKSIASVSITQTAGKAIFTNALKVFPPTKIISCVVGGAIAGTLTETLGWVVADDFYRISIGEEPEVLLESFASLAGIFSQLRFKRKT